MINFRIKVGKKPIEKALKQFKRKFSEYEIREQLIERREYTKPTTKRRKAKMEAILPRAGLDDAQRPHLSACCAAMTCLAEHQDTIRGWR